MLTDSAFKFIWTEDLLTDVSVDRASSRRRSSGGSTAPTKPSILHPRAGKASVLAKTISLSNRELTKLLRTSPPPKDSTPVVRNSQYRSCCLSLAVTMDNPSDWMMDWARFRFSVADPPTSVISYGPDSEGINLKAEQSGSTSFSAAVTLTPLAGLVSAAPTLSKDRKWQGTYTAVVDTLKGFLFEGIDPGQLQLVWELSIDRAIAAAGGSLGHAAVATTLGVFQFPKGAVNPEIAVGFEGQARRPSGPTFRTGFIEEPSLGKILLKPDF